MNTSFTKAHTHQYMATEVHPGEQCPFHTSDFAIYYRLCYAHSSTVHQPSQQHLPRGFTDAHDGEKQDLTNAHKMASKNHPASATLWVLRLGWYSSSSGASPKLYPPESLQGRAGGTCWNGSRGLEAHLLVGRGTPFPSHNSPGLL